MDLVWPLEGLNGLKVGNLASLVSCRRRLCPALGLAWANYVNWRIFLSRNEEAVGEENGLVVDVSACVMVVILCLGEQCSDFSTLFSRLI